MDIAVSDQSAGMGFPTWIIEWVRSSLFARSTSLLMPGHRSKLFWLNMGIPQGSPLSPILWALFTASLLIALEETSVLRIGHTRTEKEVLLRVCR